MTDYSDHFEATRPAWYKAVLACQRGELPLEEVPEEYRYLRVQWRPGDNRREPPGTTADPNTGPEAAPRAPGVFRPLPPLHPFPKPPQAKPPRRTFTY